MPDIMDTIFQRRSIRKYTPQAVEPEKLHSLLQAAMAAPTACNSQPWEFIVITDSDVLAQLRSKLLFGRYNAPAAIVVCGNEGIANNPASKLFWVQDCSAATENILIAATGLGLGSVWIGVHPMLPVASAVRSVLNIPDDVTPLCVIYVGYAAESKAARTQYNDQRVHWQVYEQSKPQAKIKNAQDLPQ
jgi:nitroreductase